MLFISTVTPGTFGIASIIDSANLLPKALCSGEFLFDNFVVHFSDVTFIVTLVLSATIAKQLWNYDGVFES